MSEPFPPLPQESRGPGEPEPDPPAGPLSHSEWQRLDPRMLLVQPVTEVIRFLPVLVGIFLASSATGRGVTFQLLGIAIPIVIGLVRYWTTRYRIADGRIQLERGLFSRHVVATSLDRVRTVDVTAKPIHRLLGLTSVRIGTGTGGDDELDLDGLPVERARELRARLLHAAAPPADGEQEPGAAGGEQVVARFEPRWLVYAPFTSAGLVMLAGVIGVGSQVLDGLGVFERLEPESLADQATTLGTLVAIPLAVAAALVLAAVFSVLGYLLTNGNFALSHTDPDRSWHLRRGVLTTRETSVDAERLRGVSIGEPLGLRLVRGARLSAIVTGLDRSQSGSEALLPATPRTLVDRVAAEVVGTSVPVAAPLHDHGPRARLRRFVRALVPFGLLAVALGAVVVVADWGSWLLAGPVLLLVLAAVLGLDRARGLGHILVDGWLVARSGSLTRSRELLHADAVIGWNFHSTWFQRRAGLATLTATTAGGDQRVTVLDVPEPDAVSVAHAAAPALLEQFLR